MENLFASFPPHTKEQWLAQAQKDLKGADLATLQWATEEGFSLSPFFAQEEIGGQKLFSHLDFQASEAIVGGARHWAYRQEISVSSLQEANKKALHALNNGADALCFELSAYKGEWEPKRLLDGILLPHCAVSYILGTNSLQTLVDYWKKEGYAPHEIKGSLEVSAGKEAEACAILADYKGFRPVSLKGAGTPYHTMIGNLLVQTNAFLKKMEKTPVDRALAYIEWQLPVSNNYFFQIAAQRALRLNLSLLANAYGLKHFDPASLHLHARTTVEVSEQTKADPEWNMLSNTTQAMSAVIGGCNSLTIVPHNQGITQVDDFSERIARNVSNLLREESYLDKVSDPAAGSYYLENITLLLAKQSWEYLQKQS